MAEVRELSDRVHVYELVLWSTRTSKEVSNLEMPLCMCLLQLSFTLKPVAENNRVYHAVNGNSEYKPMDI